MAIFRCGHCATINRVPDNRTASHPVCGRCKARLETSGEPQAVDDAALRDLVTSSPVPVLGSNTSTMPMVLVLSRDSPASHDASMLVSWRI